VTTPAPAAPAASNTAASSPAADRWSAAIKASRDASTWVATALGVVAAAIFGGIPALKGLPFTWGDPDDNAQTILAAVSAIVGLGGIIVVILMVTRATLPIYVTLSTLSPRTQAAIAKTPSEYLPDGIPSLDELRTQLRNWESLIPLLEEQERVADAASRAPAAEALADGIAQRDNLRQWAASIRQLDVLSQTQARLHNPGLWAAVAVATLGAVAFMFTTVARAESDPPAEIGQVALVTPVDDEAWAAITSSADLSGCADDDGRYLVLVSDVVDDAYVVQTLPNADGCRAWRLNIRPEIAQVTVLAEPMRVTVTYAPAPQPATTPEG
jgi:hypothetical protein